MITNNSNNYYVFLNVFMFQIMSMTLRNINPQKEIFHHYDFPVYTTSKCRDPKLDTYRRITLGVLDNVDLFQIYFNSPLALFLNDKLINDQLLD